MKAVLWEEEEQGTSGDYDTMAKTYISTNTTIIYTKDHS